MLKAALILLRRYIACEMKCSHSMIVRPLMVDERFSIAVYFIQWNDLHIIISRFLHDENISGLLSVDVRIESDANDMMTVLTG